MGIHFILIFIVFILCFLYRIKRDNAIKNNCKIKYFLLILAFTLMALFIGLRDVKIGIDTKYYVAWFLNKDYSFANFEILLPFISYIIHIFSSKYFIYLLCLSIISMFGIFKCAKHYSFDTEFFVFLYITSYCFIYSTSAVRFFCAFSLIVYSFIFMIKKETFKVVLVLILASMFHMTAIIFIPIYFLTKFEFNKKNITIFCFLLLIFVIFSNTIGIDFLLKTRLFSKYEYVLDFKNSLGGLSVIMNFLILIFSLIYYKNINIYKKDYEFFIKMHLIGIVLDFIGIASRFIWYFKFPIWFILPIIFINIKNTKKKDYMLLYLIFIIIYVGYYYFYLANSLEDNNFLYYMFNFTFE